MDQDLVDYLDRRFAENEETIRRTVEKSAHQLRGEIQAGLASVREDLGGEIQAVRKDLGGEIQAVRKDLGGEIQAVREGLGGEIEAVREDLGGEIRHTQVMVEHLRSDVEAIAENVVDMSAKIDRYREENEQTRREDRAFSISLFRDVKGRVDDHDARLGDLEARVTRLESA